MILETIQKAGDIKQVKKQDLPRLAREIRRFLLQTVSKNGGHLASNLGVVELTMALHLAFDLPDDEIVWDVGHQAYVHKILSGRKDQFATLRKKGGLSGFPKRSESPCDVFNTGHASTSISAALGLAEARNLQGKNNYVVAVIGDGSMTGGMAYEALNNAARMKKNFIIVLNDNAMSISENVGGIPNMLARMRTALPYNELKKDVSAALERIPVVGEPTAQLISRAKNSLKHLVISGMMFEDMGITYLGPVNGHNIAQTVEILQRAKKLDRPVLVHVFTRKGKGYPPAEKTPVKFHGLGPFDLATGNPCKSDCGPSYTDVFAGAVLEEAKADSRVVGITAAMPGGTGLLNLRNVFPERCFDVGIAEEHAVTFAAGLAAGGMKPVAAVYSSFLQRSYDQLVHDVAMQDLPVVFAVDRAGLVGADGETHQGVFDLSYLSSIPGMIVLAPKNGRELKEMLHFALGCGHPVAIRYPRRPAETCFEDIETPIEAGRWETLRSGSRAALLAVGSMVPAAAECAELLKAEGIDAALINARCVSPLDGEMLTELAGKYEVIATLEENERRGGFGEAVAGYYAARGIQVRQVIAAIPDRFVSHGEVPDLLAEAGLSAGAVAENILRALEKGNA